MQSEPGREGPPIRDPFANWDSVPPRAPEAPRSRLGTAALVAGVASLVAGPLAGVPAILMGLSARSRGPSQRGRGIAGLALGVVFSILWPAAIALVFLVAARTEKSTHPVAGRPRTHLLAPPVLPLPGPSGTVPQDTIERVEGSLVVVDVGVREDSLEAALRAQRKLANDGSQKLLVTTTRGGCEPCEGLVASLSDPLMQRALEGVRLVRVDIDVFGEDLVALRMPSDTIPGFFLPREDLTPRDWIHGGEWGLDVAINIAPVLGPFVRGTLSRREHVWELPSAGPRGFLRPPPPSAPRGPGSPPGRTPSTQPPSPGGAAGPGIWL